MISMESLSLCSSENLIKHLQVRCSNWEIDELTTRQTQYAAADAHVAIRIFVDLINQYNRNGLLTWFKADNNVWKKLDDLCWKYADVAYKQITKTKKENG